MYNPKLISWRLEIQNFKGRFYNLLEKYLIILYKKDFTSKNTY